MPMLRPTSRESTVERFIGWLTIAIGVGLMPTVALDFRHWPLVVLPPLVIGVSLIVATYYRRTTCIRMFLLAVAGGIWLTVALVTADGMSWIALVQSLVIFCFANNIAWALWRNRPK